MKLLEVSPDDIDIQDERFRFSYHFDLEKLIYSIKKIGLISPLAVVERESPQYVIVSGWKRLSACCELRLMRIPVFLLEEEDDCRVFLINLYENLAVRNFNLLEKAEIIHKLNGFIKDEKIVLRQFFPLLGIPETLSYFDIYLNIARLNSKWKKIIFKKKIPLPSVQVLTEFAPEDRESLLALILPMNLNKMKQFLEDLQDLSKKTGDTPKTILSTPEIQSLCQSVNLSPLQKSDKIRSLLRTKRNPTVSAWKKSFDDSIKKAQLSKDVIFDAPYFFEDGKFAVKFSLKNKEAFQKKLARLQDLISDEHLFLLFHGFPDE